MADSFPGFPDSAWAPARRAVDIVPSDSAALPAAPKGIWVGVGGDITLRAAESTTDVIFKSVPAGSTLPVRASHVRATGTTASALIALL